MTAGKCVFLVWRLGVLLLFSWCIVELGSGWALLLGVALGAALVYDTIRLVTR